MTVRPTVLIVFAMQEVEHRAVDERMDKCACATYRGQFMSWQLVLTRGQAHAATTSRYIALKSVFLNQRVRYNISFEMEDI
jgi:hypothetical protein